jgi:uncharacterized damage-inducible protein DinB
MNSETFSRLFELNDYCVKVNTEGFTEADGFVQPSGGGNCCNWVLGHIVATRNAILELLGESPIWSEKEVGQYKRGAEAITASTNAHSLIDIQNAFDRSQKLILNALKKKTAENLAKETDDETVGHKLTTLLFHETYHVGQLGLLRRIAGKEGAIK